MDSIIIFPFSFRPQMVNLLVDVLINKLVALIMMQTAKQKTADGVALTSA